MSVTIEHADDLPVTVGAPTMFTGTVHIQRVAAAADGSMSVGRVSFERGARTHWHVHSGEQALYFLEGRGRVQMRGEQAVDAAVGDVVHIPPMVEHWHGAHPDEEHRMRHLAVSFGSVTWLEAVAEDAYRAAAPAPAGS